MRGHHRLVPGRVWGLIAITALAFAANLQVASAEPAVSAPSGLDVQPFPGTPDASPQTVIAFPALGPGQIKALNVRGSRSGFHRGVMTSRPAGHGTAFMPRRPFTGGERVSVSAILGSPAAGTAAGAGDATRISFSFTVAVSARVGGPPSARPASDPPMGRAALDSNGVTQSFRSEDWLHAPIVSVSGTDPDPAMGDIFTDAENSLQRGPLILSPQGQLIYFRPLSQWTFDVQVQSYQGQPALTYWQGYQSAGIGIGHDVILNQHYQQVATVHAGNGYFADLHDFEITPQGDAFITVYAPVRADLTPVGGPRRGTLIDGIIQEVDIATGRVLWEWHAYGHLHFGDIYARATGSGPFDAFHINSIQQLRNGNLLISARYTWALYEINMRTGRVSTVIGGKHSSFRMGRGTQFEWQHDAHMQSDGTITVFDNGSDGPSSNESRSRALRIRLNFRTRRATLVRAYTSNPPLLSASQGSVQLLSDGNVFAGWGAAPYFIEFGPRGRQVFSVHFHPPLEAYRGYRFAWSGQPTTPPSIWAATTPTGTRVYASWNGATDVASWRVLAGSSRRTLTAVGQFPKTPRFETATWVANTEPYFAVQALSGAGKVLGTSATIAR